MRKKYCLVFYWGVAGCPRREGCVRSPVKVAGIGESPLTTHSLVIPYKKRYSRLTLDFILYFDSGFNSVF